jgi:hypothetical protein
MNRISPPIHVLFLTAALALAGCGSDDSESPDTGTVGDVAMDMADDVEPDTSDTGDTSDAEEDTQEDAGPSTLMPRLEFRAEPTGGCSGVGDCTDGVSVNVTSKRISMSSPEIQNDPIADLSDADAEMLIEDVLTESTIQKMDTGWECGSADPQGTQRYEFEGRITDEFPARQVIQNVTGCIESDSHPDSTRVQEIRMILLDLRNKYFDN